MVLKSKNEYSCDVRNEISIQISSPFISSVTSRVDQFFLLICCLLHLILCITTTYDYIGMQPLIVGSLGIESDKSMGLTSLRLLSKGCEISGISYRWDGNNVLTLSNPATVDKIILEFSHTCPNLFAPINILGTTDNWTANHTVISTKSQIRGGSVLFDKSSIIIDHGRPWPWITVHPLQHLILAAFFFSLCVCGAMGRPSLAREAAACFSVCLALLNCASALGFAALRRWRDAPPPALACAAYALFAATIDLAPQRSAACSAALGAAWFCASLACECLLHSGDLSGLLLAPPLPAATMAALGASFLIRRRRQRRDVLAAAAADAARFEAAWRRVRHEEAAELALLEAAVDEAAAGCPAQAARHRSHVSSASSVLDLVASHRAAAVGEASGPRGGARGGVTAVCSLDQLYAQAIAVAPLLRAAAVQWAAAAGGDVDAAGGWGGPEEEEGEWAAAPWAGEGLIKGPRRAAKKAAMCYGGDVSRLVGAADPTGFETDPFISV